MSFEITQNRRPAPHFFQQWDDRARIQATADRREVIDKTHVEKCVSDLLVDDESKIYVAERADRFETFRLGFFTTPQRQFDMFLEAVVNNNIPGMTTTYIRFVDYEKKEYGQLMYENGARIAVCKSDLKDVVGEKWNRGLVEITEKAQGSSGSSIEGEVYPRISRALPALIRNQKMLDKITDLRSIRRSFGYGVGFTLPDGRREAF